MYLFAWSYPEQRFSAWYPCNLSLSSFMPFFCCTVPNLPSVCICMIFFLSSAVASHSECSLYRNKYSRTLNNWCVTVTRLRAGQPRSSSIRCKEGYIFVFSRVTVPSVGAHPACFYSVGTNSCFSGDKGQGVKLTVQLVSSSEAKNECYHPSTPLYALTTCKGMTLIRL
jgi:hypothetical protein